MRALRGALLIVGAVVLLVAGSAAVLLAVLDDQDYRQIATFLAERATGRAVTIEGPFSFHLGPEPSLTASKVRVANAPWAAQPDLARIGRLEVQLALRPLLSGTLLVSRLIVEDADFELARSADGRASWVMPPGGGGLVPVLGTVALRNVDWHYRDQASGRESSIALAHLTLEGVGKIARLDGEGMWDGQKIGAQGTFGTLAQALDPAAPFPVDLSVSLPGLELTLDGTVADPAAGRGLDLRLRGRSEDIGELLGLLHSDLPLAGRLKAEAKLRGEAGALGLSDLDLGVVEGEGSEALQNLEVTGAIETIRPGHANPLKGIDLEVQLRTSTAALSGWLEREIPDLGPVQGRFALTGDSGALKLSELDLRAGSADRLLIAATGAVGAIRPASDLAVSGIDLQIEAKAAASAPLAKVLDHPLPELGPLEGRFALTGDGEVLKLSDLDLRVGSADRLMIAATGALDQIRLRPELTVQGVDLRFQAKGPASAPLAKLLDRPLPELGPLEGRFALTGDGEALKLSELDLRVGSADRLTIAASGAVGEIRLRPGLAIRGVDVRLEASAASSAALAKALDRPLPELGAAQASGRLTGGLERLDLEGVDLRAGPADRPIGVTGRIDNVLFLAKGPASATFEGDFGRLLGWALDRPLPELGRARATARLAEVGGSLRIEGLEAAAGDTDLLSAKVAGVFDDRTGLDVELSAKDLTILGTMLDTSIPPLGPFAFKGRLAGELEAPSLSGKVRLGRTDIEGTVRGSFGGARPRISGELTTPVLYLGDFGIRPHGPWQENAAAEGTPPRSGQAPTSLAALQRLDLSLSLRIDQLEGTGLSVDRAGLEVGLQGGVLRIDSDSFDLSEGSARLGATLDSSREPPEITLSATANDLRLGDILAQLRSDVPIEGELDLETTLKSSGSSLPSLMAALDGEFGMAIERGRINLRYFDLTGANLLQWLFTGAALRSGTDLSCFLARFDIEHGVATSQALFMDTSLARSSGSGTLNLVDRTIDILVRPRSTRAELVRLTTPYRIVGPLSSPSIDVSRVGLAGRVVGELALTPFNLLGSLTSLVSDWGRDQKNPCLTWTQSEPAEAGSPPGTEASAGAFPIDAMPPTIYAATAGVHVRTGPGTTYPIIDKLPKGVTAEVTGKTPGLDWYRIKLAGGGTGYVSSDLFKPASWPDMQ